MSRFALQRPGEILDYSSDWTEYLTDIGQTVTASAWSVTPAGPVLSGAQFDAAGLCSVKITGLEFGKIYELINTITRAGGSDKTAITIRCG